MPSHNARHLDALLPLLSALAFLSPEVVAAVIAALTLIELISRRF